MVPLGTATESQLKLQELTDGIIVCKNESYLGFRHGPKAVTDESTLLEFNLDIYLSDSGNQLSEEWLTVCDILPSQILGFYKSLALGLKPDDPSESGAISRVVENVIIYQY